MYTKYLQLSFLLVISISSSLLAAGDWLVYGDESCIIRKDVLSTGASYNHPANIEELANGDLIIVTVAGQSEGESTRIGVFKSSDKGETWGDLIHVTPVAESFDPTVQQADNGDVYCFYYAGCCNDHKFRVSTDNGETWGPERDVHADQMALQAGEQSNCLRHPNGDWLCGWSETVNGGQGYTSHIPKGKLGNPSDWTKHFAVDQFWNPDFMVRNPASVVNGHYQEIIAVMRTQFHNCCIGKFVYSNDGGVTWENPADIGYVGNGVGCSETEGSMGGAAPTGVSLDLDGGPLLGWHVMAQGGEARYCPESGCSKSRCERWFMRVFVSSSGDADDWEEKLEIRESSGGSENADCSIIQDSERFIHLIWTGRGTRKVRYAKIDPGLLVGESATSLKEVSHLTQSYNIGRQLNSTEHFNPKGEFLGSNLKPDLNSSKTAKGIVVEKSGNVITKRAFIDQ